MSNSDYQAGLGAGFSKARAISAEAHAAVAEWAEHASKLEARLLNESVERCVSVDYVRELRRALEELSPSHRLLQEGVALQMFEVSRARAYKERGYHYDVNTRRISKRA